MSRYVFDLETNGFLDVVNVIHSLVFQDIDTGEMFSCADQPGHMPIGSGLRMLSHADELIAHNGIKYDIPVIEKLYPHLWKRFSGKVTDTLIMTRLFFPTIKDTDFRIRENRQKRGLEPTLPGQRIGSHALEAWGYRLGEMKGDYSEIMKEKGLDPWSVWNQDMQEYCEQDVRVTARLYHMMASKYDIEKEWATALDIEHRFQQAIHAQELHGFNFDEKAAVKLEAELRVQRAKLEAGLFDLFAPWWVGLGKFIPAKSVKRFIQSEHGAIIRTVKKETGDTYQHTQKNGKVVTRRVKVEVEQRGYFETLYSPYRTIETGETEEVIDSYDERTGEPVYVTRPKVERILAESDDWISPYREGSYQKAELRVFNPSSRHHIEDRLRKLYGWNPQEFTPSGQAKIDDEILNDLPYPPAKALAEYFMYDKRLGQLADGKQAWLKQVKDGRIHGRVNTLGAITGRCTHSHPNVAQVPSIENAKGVVPYGAACRDLFVPDRGHVLVGCDASGLELRCLAHFMKDGGRYSRIVLEGDKSKGTDIHTQNQKAAGLPSRSNAKTFIYAFLYGAGNEKIGSIVGGGAKEGGALKNKFLKNTPGLKGLINAVKAAAKKNGWVRGIDGRRVPVRHQHAALNTLLQNAGAVAMKLATALVYERMNDLGHTHGKDWALVANVHDEFQITCAPELADTVCEVAEWSIAEAGRQLGFVCPLEGEAEVGSSWKETH